MWGPLTVRPIAILWSTYPPTGCVRCISIIGPAGSPRHFFLYKYSFLTILSLFFFFSSDKLVSVFVGASQAQHAI